jgi:hypothetical protein
MRFYMYKVRLRHRCELCNQVLQDEESIKNRLGPICHHKVWGSLKPMDWDPEKTLEFDNNCWAWATLPDHLTEGWSHLGAECNLGFEQCHMGWELDDGYRLQVTRVGHDCITQWYGCEGCIYHLRLYEEAGRPDD